MPFDDFCRCTFGEFEAICRAWTARAEAEYRDGWERSRLLAAISIQPHVSKKITPQQLIPLPWDNKEVDARPEPKPHDAAAARKRFEELTTRGI